MMLATLATAWLSRHALRAAASKISDVVMIQIVWSPATTNASTFSSTADGALISSMRGRLAPDRPSNSNAHTRTTAALVMTNLLAAVRQPLTDRARRRERRLRSAADAGTARR